MTNDRPNSPFGRRGSVSDPSIYEMRDLYDNIQYSKGEENVLRLLIDARNREKNDLDTRLGSWYSRFIPKSLPGFGSESVKTRLQSMDANITYIARYLRMIESNPSFQNLELSEKNQVRRQMNERLAGVIEQRRNGKGSNASNLVKDALWVAGLGLIVGGPAVAGLGLSFVPALQAAAPFVAAASFVTTKLFGSKLAEKSSSFFDNVRSLVKERFPNSYTQSMKANDAVKNISKFDTLQIPMEGLKSDLEILREDGFNEFVNVVQIKNDSLFNRGSEDSRSEFDRVDLSVELSAEEKKHNHEVADKLGDTVSKMNQKDQVGIDSTDVDITFENRKRFVKEQINNDKAPSMLKT